MNPLLFKLLFAGGLVAALIAGGATWHHSIYADGLRDGEAKVRKEVDLARAEIERTNKTIVNKDQQLVVAKAEDKEKIRIIYRTIRDQLEPTIVEKPVFTSCRIGLDSLRLLTEAAADGLRADTGNIANNPAGDVASPQK